MAIEKLTEFAKTGQKNTDDLDLETGFIVNRKPARQWFNWLFNTLTTKINEIIDADFMPKSDVVDNLTTNDATKPVSAKQARLLQDNKLDKTANAVSATKLQTARTIGGVLFDGSVNINLPGVNTSGNQNTTGNAASATKLQTSRQVSFSGAATGSFNFDGSTGTSCTLTLANSGVTAGTYGTTLKIPVITVNAKGLITTVTTQDIPSASTSAKGLVQLNDTLTSTSTTEALTAAQGKVLNDKLLGLSQGYAVVTGSRVKNTTYTNTTGRPLYLYVQNISSAAITSLALSITVNGVTMGFNGGGDAASGATKSVSAYLVVPIGATYTVKSDFTAWVELR